MTDQLMAVLLQLPPAFVLVAVALLPALEASAFVGLIIPGETAVSGLSAFGFVQQRGAWAVLLGRWTALLRALVPSIAGASGLRWRDFSVANFVGGTSWVAIVSVVGFSAGAAYHQVAATMGRAGEIALAVATVAGVAVVARREFRRRRV